MAEVLKLKNSLTAVELLSDMLEQAQRGDIAALVVITKNRQDEYEVWSLSGTSAMERAGMCCFAEHAMLDKMREID